MRRRLRDDDALPAYEDEGFWEYLGRMRLFGPPTVRGDGVIDLDAARERREVEGFFQLMRRGVVRLGPRARGGVK